MLLKLNTVISLSEVVLCQTKIHMRGGLFFANLAISHSKVVQHYYFTDRLNINISHVSVAKVASIICQKLSSRVALLS